MATKVKKYLTDGIQAVYGLENAYGYGRALAVWLIQKGYFVKDVNPALSFAQRKSTPIYKKDDSHDAEAVALVLINKLDTLPGAVPDDAYWTISQLMRRRDTIKTHQVRLKNQLQRRVVKDFFIKLKNLIEHHQMIFNSLSFVLRDFVGLLCYYYKKR